MTTRTTKQATRAAKRVEQQTLLTSASKHSGVLKGFTLLLLGFVLVALTSPVIVKLLVLIAGLFMIYAGLHLLHVTQITQFVNDILASLRQASTK